MSKAQTKKGMVFESELSKYMKLRGIGSKEKLRSLTTVGSHQTIIIKNKNKIISILQKELDKKEMSLGVIKLICLGFVGTDSFSMGSK